MELMDSNFKSVIPKIKLGIPRYISVVGLSVYLTRTDLTEFLGKNIW